MIKLNLVSLATGEELSAVLNINKNERMISFNVSELSDEAQEQILAVLNAHLENMSPSALITKLAK